jgi:hypothetical protein
MLNKSRGVLSSAKRKTHLKRYGVKVMAEPLENFTLPNLQRQLAQFKSTFGQLLKSKTSATKAQRGSKNAFCTAEKREQFLEMRARKLSLLLELLAFMKWSSCWIWDRQLGGQWSCASCLLRELTGALLLERARATRRSTKINISPAALSVLQKNENFIRFLDVRSQNIVARAARFFDKKNTPRSQAREKSSSVDSRATHNNTNIWF